MKGARQVDAVQNEMPRVLRVSGVQSALSDLSRDVTSWLPAHQVIRYHTTLVTHPICGTQDCTYCTGVFHRFILSVIYRRYIIN